MRDAAALGLAGLRRPDVHAPVELHGVGVDDLSSEPPGELDGEGGLARSGRADDGDDGRGWAHAAAQSPTRYPTPNGAESRWSRPTMSRPHSAAPTARQV